MASITGKYLHERSENLDEYFKVLGVPYIPRKMILMSNPSMEILNNDDSWTIIVATMMRTNETKFKLGDDYEEVMPGGILKNITVLEDNKLITKSVAENGMKTVRIYEFNETHCVLTLTHEQSGTTAKRFFKRA